jgi:hypothetical protein
MAWTVSKACFTSRLPGDAADAWSHQRRQQKRLFPPGQFTAPQQGFSLSDRAVLDNNHSRNRGQIQQLFLAIVKKVDER